TAKQQITSVHILNSSKRILNTVNQSKHPDMLSDGNTLIQIYILRCIQQFYAVFKRFLKCFSSHDQSHTAGALVDNRCCNCICQIFCSFTFTTTVYQSDFSTVTI